MNNANLRSMKALSIKVQVMSETGLRPIEIQGEKGLQVKSIHIDQKSITALSTKRLQCKTSNENI